jgi:hypothetical protein
MSSIVSHVIFHNDNNPLTTSGIHVIVAAISCFLWRLVHRFWLPFWVWCEPHPLFTSVLAEPQIEPDPISGARAPDHVPAKTAIMSQLHQGQTRPSIFPESYQLGLHGSQCHYFSYKLQITNSSSYLNRLCPV